MLSSEGKILIKNRWECRHFLLENW